VLTDRDRAERHITVASRLRVFDYMMIILQQRRRKVSFGLASIGKGNGFAFFRRQ
jgi:hypothetical protein